ncbi:MAG: Hint domain-containing protein [Rhodobacteraceae bacterium]|nr:Hint domain-containing protein [Paracoccaceae bacterium]
MPTSYSDQFFVMDPGVPPGSGTPLTVQIFNFVDVNDDGDISPGDTFNGAVITRVWVGDTVTMFVPGTGTITITGVTFYVTGQPAVFTPTDGTILADGTFTSSTFVNSSTQVPVSDLLPACFTPGTLIDTIDGVRPVEEICEGDLLCTADHGYQPVVWIGRCKVMARGKYAPIRISAGAMGNTRDLIVSPQHRILVEGWAAEPYAGQDAVLVAARHLVDGITVHVMEGGDVEYIHLGFTGHVLIKSEGIWTESHFSSVAAVAEAEALFPGYVQGAQLVRPAARKHESSLIAASMLS